MTDDDRQAELERLAAVGLATAGLAHELKNGLMVTQGFAELARKLLLATPHPDPRVAGHLAEIEGQAQRLTRQLRSFLQLARAEGDTSERPLGEVLEEVVALVRPLARVGEKALLTRVETDAGRPVRDPPFRSAVLNLLLNAVDLAREQVTLTLTGDDTHLELAVEDDGPGLSDALITRLFEPFSTGRPNGIGLGLAQVKAAVKAERGEVTAGRSVGGGARFVVRLPRF
jgi:signal transduction histidine kinase